MAVGPGPPESRTLAQLGELADLRHREPATVRDRTNAILASDGLTDREPGHRRVGARPRLPRIGSARRRRAPVPQRRPAGRGHRRQPRRVAGPGQHGHLAAQPGRRRRGRSRDHPGRRARSRVGPGPGRPAGRPRAAAHRPAGRVPGPLLRGPAPAAPGGRRRQHLPAADQPGHPVRLPGRHRRRPGRPGRGRAVGHRARAVGAGGHGCSQPRLHRGPAAVRCRPPWPPSTGPRRPTPLSGGHPGWWRAWPPTAARCCCRWG